MSTTTVWKGLLTLVLFAAMFYLMGTANTGLELVFLFIVSAGAGSFIVQTLFSFSADRSDRRFRKEVENWD